MVFISAGKKEHPVALVQLAAANNVWLIRLNVIGKMPASLARILESRTYDVQLPSAPSVSDLGSFSIVQHSEGWRCHFG